MSRQSLFKKLQNRSGRDVAPFIVATILLVSGAGTANALSPNWRGGSGTWDDATTANWDTGTVPSNTDVVGIKSSNVTLNISYTAANLTYNHATNIGGIRLTTLNLYNPGSGALTLTLDGADALPVQNHAYIGGASAGGPTTFNVRDSAYFTCGNGGNKLWVGGNATHAATLNQTGGTIYSAYGLNIETNGAYNLSTGGTYSSVRSLTVNGGGTWEQTGGDSIHNYGMTINGTFNLSGGTVTPAGEIILGRNANVNWTGGTFPNFNSSLRLNGPFATWSMKGGTLTLNNGNPANGLFVTPTNTVQGYGQIKDTYFGGSGGGKLENSGRIIANGYGVNNTLDLSWFKQSPFVTQIYNTTDNTTNNGWFAVNKGQLLLPALPIIAGTGATNWGEAAADTTLDLVNSARISFTGATAGSFTGQLYAVDSSVVPEGLRKPVGVWSFGGVTCTTAVVTFRYDDAAAASNGVEAADLNIWRHNGVKWQNVTDTRDTTAKTITSQSIATWPKAPTFFAVAGSPRGAGAMILIK